MNDPYCEKMIIIGRLAILNLQDYNPNIKIINQEWLNHNMVFDERKYQATLDYLYKFVDYSLTRQLRYSPEKFDLNRMRVFMDKLGNPEKAYPVIHIAGTKGKGSTAAMIASVLQEAGYKVGLYTSPHLHDYTERIQINRRSISHEAMTNLVEELKPVIESIPELTTFEITTALGFTYFSREKVDIAVIEVGLGGRLDATNVVTPLLSVITSLSYDHMNVLGNSITEIATEKAGIIKPGVPVVLAPQIEHAQKTVEKIAQERGSQLILTGRDFLFASKDHSLQGQEIYLWSSSDQAKMNEFLKYGGRSDWQPEKITIPLLGYHQVQNAATAYATLQTVARVGIKFTRANLLDGFAKVKWAGRFEILRHHPIVVVDSAHNQDSALKLRIAMDDYLNGLPITLIFGVSEDKDIKGMFEQLLPKVKNLIATKSIHPRAAEPEKLVELAQQYGKPAYITHSIEEALNLGNELAGKDGAIVIAGSIFVAAAAIEVWPEIDKKS